MSRDVIFDEDASWSTNTETQPKIPLINKGESTPSVVHISTPNGTASGDQMTAQHQELQVLKIVLT